MPVVAANVSIPRLGSPQLAHLCAAPADLVDEMFQSLDEGFNKHKIRHVRRGKFSVERAEIFGQRGEIKISTRFYQCYDELSTGFWRQTQLNIRLHTFGRWLAVEIRLLLE